MTDNDVFNNTAPNAKPYSYDEVLYPNNPFPQSHPDRMATIAKLFGLQPQPISCARVLELGCNRGGNLIPLAEQLPGSHFVGIELAETQVAAAHRCIQALDLQNIEVRLQNILDIQPDLGLFDYIIVHGVFSWVPTVVQEKILSICAAHLTPNGVAYISYNTFPGWNMRGMIRDMMCYHTSRFVDPKVRIQQARALLDFLAQNTSEKTSYGMFLKSELEVLRNHQDGYLFHEHLEDVNEPIYFHAFMERAVAHGLQYLSESDISAMYAGHLPTEVASTLERIASDLIQMEQYMDFLRNRTFRQTLLCHASVKVDRELKPCDLSDLHVAAPLVPPGPRPDLLSREPLQFKHVGTGVSITATTPLLKGVLACLGEIWPESRTFSDLLRIARSRVDKRVVISARQCEDELNEVGKAMLRFYLNNLIELHFEKPCFSIRVQTYPETSAVARYQVSTGAKVVTTLRHHQRKLNDLELHLFPLLDGKHDRAALLAALTEFVRQGILNLPPDTPPEAAQARLAEALDSTLQSLASAPLLLDRGSNPTPAPEPVAVTEGGEAPSWGQLWNPG